MVRTSLAPGFRFHPTDDELILYYLKRKILGKKFHYEAIAEVNIYKYSPWDLPDKSLLKTKDLEWFFFCPREKKYASGARVKRATKNGFWKTTGNERNIYWNTKTVGTVRTLIFHLGHAPKGERTNWVIYEYKILDDQLAEAGVQDNYVLCKVFEKKGAGPKNGAQYGAPFNEADWADDEDDNVARDCVLPLADDGQYPTVPIQNEEQHLPLETGLCGSGNGSLPIPAEGTSASAVVSASMIAADETTDDTMRRLLGLFVPENGNGHNQVDLTDSGKKKLLPLEGLDIYDDLRDLDCWSQMEEDRFDFSGAQNFDDPLTSSLSKDNANYIELDDLQHPLDCSNEANGTHSSLLCQTSASYSHESMQQWYSDTRFSGMNQYNSFSTNDLAIPPYIYEGGDSLAALQMLNPQHYQGSNASYYFDSPIWHLENAVCTPDNMMERGSHLEKSYSRFVECIPPSAAELLALSLSTYGGSSIHIKAEVNHGAGECTNEALSVMMGGSSSCWCILIFRKIQIRLWVIEGLLDVVEFISALIVVCCLNDTISWIYHEYHINDIYHIHQDNQNRLILFCISSFAIFFRSYALFNILLLAFLPLLATDKASYLLGLSSNSFCLFVDSLQFPTICLIKTKVTGLVGS